MVGFACNDREPESQLDIRVTGTSVHRHFQVLHRLIIRRHQLIVFNGTMAGLINEIDILGVFLFC